MSKKEKRSSKNSKKTIVLRIPYLKFAEYKQHTEEKGISFNTLCLFALDQYLFPIKDDSEHFIKEINQVSTIIKKLELEFHDLESQKHSILNKTDNIHINDQVRIQDKILNFLTKCQMAQSEYLIAQEINEDVDIVFVILTYLLKLKKITQTKDLKWKIT